MKDGHGNFVNIHPTVSRGRMKPLLPPPLPSTSEENSIRVRRNVQFAFVRAKKFVTNGNELYYEILIKSLSWRAVYPTDINITIARRRWWTTSSYLVLAFHIRATMIDDRCPGSSRAIDVTTIYHPPLRVSEQQDAKTVLRNPRKFDDLNATKNGSIRGRCNRFVHTSAEASPPPFSLEIAVWQSPIGKLSTARNNL